MNEVLDQLEREHFFDADVFVLPPENGESDGDSENSDDEQSAAVSFAEHFTPLILKGEGCVTFTDDSGSHVIGSQNDDDESVITDTSDVQKSTTGEQQTRFVSAQVNLSKERTKRLLKQKTQLPKRLKAGGEQLTAESMSMSETNLIHEGNLPRTWKKADLKNPQYNRFKWNGNVADNLPDMEPSGYFELFWNDELFQKIQNFSKIYAAQQDPRSSFDVSVDELKVVVGILLISGYSTVPRRRLYWSSENDVRNDMIANAMSRNRFDEILSKLHCANNAELPQSDRFGKVRPLISHLNEKYMQHWQVSQQLSVDESMIPYYGHHGCKQHIHGKPIRFGFKMWSLNASTDGYWSHTRVQGQG